MSLQRTPDAISFDAPLGPRLARALAEVSRALERQAPDEAWAALCPFAAQVTEDRELAMAWLTLLRITPRREGLLADVRRIADRWPNDAAVVATGCDALIRAAELRGADEPFAGDGPAATAADLALRCLAALQPADRARAAIGGYLHMGRANALRLAHQYDEALVAGRAALATDAANGEWWWNMGLLHKARAAFADALEANERARCLLGDRKGILWNRAICATALGHGAVARDALCALGFPATLSPGGMPQVEHLPLVQVRVASRSSGYEAAQDPMQRAVIFELVWVSPLSPCHGVVQSATQRDAAVDYGDVVLWDGTPIGMGERDGVPVPRFPLLAVLRRGDERKFRFIALEQNAGDTAAFGAELPEGALYFELRAAGEHLCARCANGEPMSTHPHMTPEPHRVVYGKLVVPAAVDLASFRAAFDALARKHPTVQLVVPGLLEALGETAAAGKAHQLWRGLSKSANNAGTKANAGRS